MVPVVERLDGVFGLDKLVRTSKAWKKRLILALVKEGYVDEEGSYPTDFHGIVFSFRDLESGNPETVYDWVHNRLTRDWHPDTPQFMAPVAYMDCPLDVRPENYLMNIAEYVRGTGEFPRVPISIDFAHENGSLVAILKEPAELTFRQP